MTTLSIVQLTTMTLQKNTKQNRQREQAHRLNSRANQAQVSKECLPVELRGMFLTGLAMSCNDTCEISCARAVH